MRVSTFKLLPALLLVVLFPIQVFAAKVPPGVKNAGETVETPYFSVTIPAGWYMPEPVKKQPLDGISAVFATTSGTMALAISIMKAGMTAKELAQQTAANMAKTGLKITTPRKKGGFWQIDIKGQANGEGWFGANGKFCSVITLFGKNFADANVFLSALATEYPELFPRKVTEP